MSFLKGFFIHFEPKMMPKWRQIGTKVEAKTGLNTKTPQSLKCYKNQYFFNKFGVRGDRFENQNRSNIGEKTEPRSKCVPTSMFNRFLVYFGSILAPKSTQKRSKKHRKNDLEKKRSERGLMIDFGPLTSIGPSHPGSGEDPSLLGG